MQPSSPIEAFDELLYRAEKAVVAGMLAIMGAVVFLDVLHRVSTREGSWLANPLVVAPLVGGVAILALLTRGVSQPVAKGLGIGVGLAAAQFAFVKLVPNGLVWSQSLALALTLWLGTIGASLAAHDRRHLAMDVGAKLLPPSIAGKAAAIGHLLTASFCALLFVLGVRSVLGHWDLWTATDGAAGNLSGLALPKWFPALAIPYGMAVLVFRFTLDAWRTWTGRLEVGGDDTLHQLGIQVDEGGKP